MYTITFETDDYKQWGHDCVFTSFSDAVKYLEDKGFINRNRIFEKKATNWTGKEKAYIKPLKVIYSKEEVQNVKNPLEFLPTEVEKLVFKDGEGTSNYMNVSIEEMDYMMNCAMKYQKLHQAWFNGIKNEVPTILFLRECKAVIEDFTIPSEKPMT